MAVEELESKYKTRRGGYMDNDEEMADARTMKEDMENVENLTWLNNRVNQLQTELNLCRENIENMADIITRLSGKYTYRDLDSLGRNTYQDYKGRPHVRGYGIEIISDLKEMIERESAKGEELLHLDFEVCISDRWLASNGQYQCNITNFHTEEE